MSDAGGFYFKANPAVGKFLEDMEGKDLTYLVHEHLNESWSALYHADVVADFAATRLSYACAAQMADDIAETSIPITAHDIMPSTSDTAWRETVKDFLVGRSFRRDIFVRGSLKLTPAERMKELDRFFMLIVPRSIATTKIRTPMGDVEGRIDVYSAVLDLLADGPKRLSQLLAQAIGPAGNPAALIQTLALLVDSGQVKTMRADAGIDPGPGAPAQSCDGARNDVWQGFPRPRRAGDRYRRPGRSFPILDWCWRRRKASVSMPRTSHGRPGR